VVTRAQLLKRNPAVIAARALIEKNAINPDRLDLESIRTVPMGDKSIQVRAEIMLTVPLSDYLEAVEYAQESIYEEERAAVREAEEIAVSAEEIEQVKTLGEQLGIATLPEEPNRLPEFMTLPGDAAKLAAERDTDDDGF